VFRRLRVFVAIGKNEFVLFSVILKTWIKDQKMFIAMLRA
jgi:hypothetical protein